MSTSDHDSPHGHPLVPVERRRRIAQLVEANGSVTVAGLEEVFGISPMTVRRDLVALEREGSVVAACGSVLSGYAPEGTQYEQRTLSAVSCPDGNCLVSSTSLAALPGQGLVLTGSQRHGGPGTDWDQEAFLRLLVPGTATP